MTEFPETSANSTANAVVAHAEADGSQASPVRDEKHISTSGKASLHQNGSLPVPEVAPVLGAGGLVGISPEKAEYAATVFKQHPVIETHEHNEKHTHGEHPAQISDKEGSAGTSLPVVKESEGETDAEDEDEIVYPAKLQLSLLTLGLCLATFTVALGMSKSIVLCSLQSLVSCLGSAAGWNTPLVRMLLAVIDFYINDRITNMNLDNTIIATAIPKITSVFDSLNDVGWVSDNFDSIFACILDPHHSNNAFTSFASSSLPMQKSLHW